MGCITSVFDVVAKYLRYDFLEIWQQKVCAYSLVIHQTGNSFYIMDRSNSTLYMNYYNIGWDSMI